MTHDLLRHYRFARRVRPAGTGIVQRSAHEALELAKYRIEARDALRVRHPNVATDYDATDYDVTD